MSRVIYLSLAMSFLKTEVFEGFTHGRCQLRRYIDEMDGN